MTQFKKNLKSSKDNKFFRIKIKKRYIVKYSSSGEEGLLSGDEGFNDLVYKRILNAFNIKLFDLSMKKTNKDSINTRKELTDYYEFER
jgi:hypothetical protein